jgi:peptidoglycan/LPS O-acetylase OafA/YrhL
LETRNDPKIGKHPFFANLNGLRFISALAIFFFHAFTLGREMWGDFTGNTIFKACYVLAGKGHVGVLFFFVISGFLITHLLLWENQQRGKISVSHFLLRRTLRIWPLYFLVVCFGFFLFPLLPCGIVTVHEFWRFALFLSNIDEILVGARDPINFLSATWSVSVEEQFYLAWAVLIGFMAFRKWQTYLGFFILIIAASLAFRWYYIDQLRVIYYHTFAVMSDLAIGGIIGLLAFKAKIQDFFRNLPKWVIIGVYVAGIMLILLETKLFHSYLLIFERLVYAGFFAFVVLEQIYAQHSFYKIDSIPGMASSGELTYGFYMFHCIFLYYWQQLFVHFGWTEQAIYFVLYLLLSFVSTYVLAWLSYHYFEKPFLKLKKHFR